MLQLLGALSACNAMLTGTVMHDAPHRWTQITTHDVLGVSSTKTTYGR